ncbi:MAG: hypothetical protein RA160_01590 [Arsenophonus sp.]|nr:MAG: hypothetical protein RA160_01590 [Arsenophonus sp.]
MQKSRTDVYVDWRKITILIFLRSTDFYKDKNFIFPIFFCAGSGNIYLMRVLP